MSNPHDADPAATLRDLVLGYRVSQAIHVAATLGIAERLGGGPRTSDELAEDTGSHPDTLYRLLRALAAAGVLHEEDGRRFSLTPVGDRLRPDAPGSQATWAAFVGRPHHWDAWGNLLHSVQTGENAFHARYGTSVWDYRAEHPEESTIFDAVMTAMTRAANASLLEAFDFGPFDTVVDVGGGRGALLAAVLGKHSSLQGVLFDQPHVVAGGAQILEEAGVADRCRVESGSFFEAVPEGGDAYLLKAIVHDWEDEEAAAILRTCRRAIRPDGTLLVVERILDAPNEGVDTKFSDLNMLVGPGGRERTLDEFRALFERAGFEFRGSTATGGVQAIIAATPV
jgi:O-methyltransferase domain/Dimerisation domain